jgi:hypothetical protein
MTSLVMPSELPIYIYDSNYHEKELYAVHPVNTEENIKRLAEFYVDPARVHVVTDNSYLQRELSLKKKSILILGGGYTYFLLKELESAQSIVKDATSNGRLNIWGQCSGGNVLCQELLVKKRKQAKDIHNMKPLGLLPIVADASVYPIKTSDVTGELANRRIASLVTPSNESFGCFWYRGSQYKPAEALRQRSISRLAPMAYYADIEQEKYSQGMPVAEVCGVTFKGSKIIASGMHPEITNVDIPGQISVSERLSSDKARKNHLASIYQILGVIPSMKAKL